MGRTEAGTNRYQLKMVEHPDGKLEFSHPELSSGQAMALGIMLIRMQTDDDPPEKIQKFLKLSIKFCAWARHASLSELAECEKEILKKSTPDQVVEAAFFAGAIKRLAQGGAQ